MHRRFLIIFLINNFFLLAGMNAQHDSGLLPQMTVQNLAALAAMTQPMQAAQQPSAQLSNAAALLCK